MRSRRGSAGSSHPSPIAPEPLSQVCRARGAGRGGLPCAQGPHIPQPFMEPWVRGAGHGAARRESRDSAVTHRAPKETCRSREHRPAPCPGGSPRSRELGASCGENGVWELGQDPKRSHLSSPTVQSLAWPQSLEEFTFPWQTQAPGGSSWVSPAFLTPTPCAAAVPGASCGDEEAVMGTGSWAEGPQHLSKPCWTRAAFLVASLVSQGRILKQKAINALRGSRETELWPWCGM